MVWAYIAFFAILAVWMLLLTEWNTKAIAFYESFFRKRKVPTYEDNPSYQVILSRHIRYYILLSPAAKKKFVNRVANFIQHKKFVGMDGLIITEEMKVLISASAIQLTFGMEKYFMEFFTLIRVYPKYFYSKLLHAELRGGASEAGVLMLSWEDFLMGYKYPHDNYNLGLHEMAHVLKINVLRGSDFDDKFSFYLDEWLEIGAAEFSRLKHKDKSLLRTYGGTNKHEFFAVCVEHFFENPASFRDRLPDIYNHLCFLLNQDPTNESNDYQLSENFVEQVNNRQELIPIPADVKKHYKYHSWHWTYTIMLFGIFAGIISTLLLVSFTIIPLLHLILIAFTGALIAFVIQYRYLVVKNRIFKPADFGIYTAFGIMPAVAGSFLLINFFFRISYEVEVYPVEEIGIRQGELVLVLKENAYADNPSVRTIRNGRFHGVGKKDALLKITFAKGVFGYKYHLENELILAGQVYLPEIPLAAKNPVVQAD
jgi:MtfA peptidase